MQIKHFVVFAQAFITMESPASSAPPLLINLSAIVVLVSRGLALLVSTALPLPASLNAQPALDMV
jgi:hypothetical protein